MIHQQVSSGGSKGASPLEQHFGLGQAEKIERAEIFWPVTRKTQTLLNLKLDQRYVINEE